MTISCGLCLCWNIDSRKIIWPREHILVQKMKVCLKGLTLSDFRTYVYTYEIPKPLRLLYVYIRTRTLRSKYGASNRHFTVSPHRPHEVFTCFRSAAGSHFTACLPTEEKWSLVGVVRCFWQVLENYDCRTKFNSSLGMEYSGTLYGFSAMKVKLVDSLI